MSPPVASAPPAAGFAVPVSPAQRRLWFLDRLVPGRALYTIHNAVPLGRVSPRLVQASLDEVVRRHESLRTTFREVDAEPVQVVHERLALPVRLVDLMRLPPQLREAAAADFAAAEAAQPFDLVTGPLLRVALLRRAEDRHLLLLTVHHIVADGWSLSVFFRDFTTCYSALAAGRPSPLPPLRVQYADFAVWQAERLANSDPTHVAYWRDHLAELPTLDLPTDRPRPAAPSFASGVHRLALPGRLVARLESVARAEGATLFMTLLAGFLLTLRDHSGQDDLVVGVPVAGRDRSELEPLIGFFVNMLVLRVRVTGRENFREVLRAVRREVLNAFAHQEVPFDRVVEELRLPRDLSRHPLFQVAFQLHQRAEAATPVVGRRGVPAPEVPSTSSNFDLHLEFWPDADRLAGRLTYSTDLFDPATVELQAAHLLRVIRAVAQDPDRPVGEVDTLGETERRQLFAWGSGTGRYESGTTIPALVAAAARRDPDAVALRAGADELTYRQLGDRANQVAHGLLRLGLRPQEPVGVLADRSPHLVPALLGLLKAGGAYLGIEPAEPTRRIEQLLRLAGSRFLLALDEPARELRASGVLGDDVTVLSLDGEQSIWRGAPRHCPDTRVEPDHVAYVSFTSGSTGEPKGVAVPHRGVARLVTGTSFHAIRRDETFLLLSPLAFDATTMEIWGPLANGAQLVIAPPGPLSLATIGRLVQAEGVTTLFATAGLFHQLVDAELPRLAGVRTFMSGGDVLSAAHLRRVLAMPSRPVVINAYGPTENTAYTTCHVLTDPAAVPDRVPIGRPVSGTTVFVLDGARRPVPVGVPGDLWTGGEGLALGYLGDEAATRAVFVEGPFAHVPARRLYLTGDRARWRPDGTLDFLGRADRQVKVRGFRVEPGEVEAALTDLPEVGDCAVLVVGDTPDDRTLVAFVVAAQEGLVLRVDELTEHVRRRLPRYMVPATVLQVPRLPLTVNGKIDRKALLGSLHAPGTQPSGCVSPRTEVEAALVPIWAEVLGVPEVSVHAEFFADLGGHSLLGTRLVARVRDVFDVDLPLKALFDAPTVAGMAVAVESLILDDLQGRPGPVAAPPPGAGDEA